MSHYKLHFTQFVCLCTNTTKVLMKHKKQSRTISLVYMLLKYSVLPSDFGYAAKLYHARKLMYSINVFQKKEDEVNVIDDVFHICKDCL